MGLDELIWHVRGERGMCTLGFEDGILHVKSRHMVGPVFEQIKNAHAKICELKSLVVCVDRSTATSPP